MTSADSLVEVYPPRVLEHFRHPRGAGGLEPGPQVVQVRVGEQRLGAVVELGLRVEAGRVVQAGFRAFGCPYLIAAASELVEHAEGRRRDELDAWSWKTQAQRLGVPTERFGRLLLVEDALRACLARWRDPE